MLKLLPSDFEDAKAMRSEVMGQLRRQWDLRQQSTAAVPKKEASTRAPVDV